MLNGVLVGIRVMREKIEKERPDKKQYIQNAKMSERDLEFVRDVMDNIEKENYALGSRCFDLERINMELKLENQKLNEAVKNLTERVNL